MPISFFEDTPVLLDIDYARQFNAGLNFPPLLDTETDCAVISRYQTHMETVIDKVKAVYCSISQKDNRVKINTLLGHTST